MPLDWNAMIEKSHADTKPELAELKREGTNIAALGGTMAILMRGMLGQLVDHCNCLERRIAELEGGTKPKDIADRAREKLAARLGTQ